jgi:acyl transferase domain-containing protein
MCRVNRSNADIDARSVAVIGMACRFPGASDTDRFWEVLRDGVDATGETPADRYDLDALYSAAGGAGTIGSRRAGYVDGVADFDAEFFEMSPAEAGELDPQHRLLLMATWEAMEDAGQRPDALAGSRTGVFVGNARADFLERQFRKGLRAVTPAAFHNYRSVLPARVSYFFDFHGPSITVDTACSSSLSAIHAAVQSVRAKECPLAVVAGVNLALLPEESVLMTQAGTLAGDGRSKFGDAAADGFAPSDGVGVVVLKPLGVARADGDRIRAVIRGSAISNDGRTGSSLLTPSAAGQTEVLRWAYEDAGVSPADVDFVEAHGAGSPTLDAAELLALGEVLGEGRPSSRPCYVGSVKTNIGHAEAAGGMAGLIKTVLCLEHGQVPPSLHHRTPTSLVDWDELPLTVPTRLHALPDRGRPALAGITGQGVSALNAHLVVAQGDARAEDGHTDPDGTRYVLALSARTPVALHALARAYIDYLGPDGKGSTFSLRDICYSAAMRRQHHAHRLALTGTSHAEMIAALTGADPEHGQLGSLSDGVKRYVRGQALSRNLFGAGCRFVPLPTYRWQTRRYWPGERTAEDGTGDLAAAVLREHARTAETEVADSALLSEIGIDSLALLLIIVELARDHDYDVDTEEVARLRTVGELRGWVRSLEELAA